jgi:hypothetical protein
MECMRKMPSGLTITTYIKHCMIFTRYNRDDCHSMSFHCLALKNCETDTPHNFLLVLEILYSA